MKRIRDHPPGGEDLARREDRQAHAGQRDGAGILEVQRGPSEAVVEGKTSPVGKAGPEGQGRGPGTFTVGGCEGAEGRSKGMGGGEEEYLRSAEEPGEEGWGKLKGGEVFGSIKFMTSFSVCSHLRQPGYTLGSSTALHSR